VSLCPGNHNAFINRRPRAVRESDTEETGVSHMKSSIPKSGPQGERPKDPGVQGEGDYVSATKYNQRTREFVQSGKVEDAAGRATPRSAEEEAEMRRAEEEGRSHAKGGDAGSSRSSSGAGSGSRKPRSQGR
jgi:hypothetical protein